MFELVFMILASPLGTLVLSAFQDSLYAVIVLSDCDECGFNDLGKLLFGGLILAIIVGVGGSLLWRRIREKQNSGSEFVSIKSNGRA